MRSQQHDGVRNGQLVRLLAILRDLDRMDGADLYELAERHGATVRTIRRDLDALQQAGLPLIEEPCGKRKRWRVAFGDHLQRLSKLLDASHYLALRAAITEVAGAHKESAVFASLEDLTEKIEQVLGPRERKRLAAIERCFFSVERAAYVRAAPDVLWPLVEAASARRMCQVTYRAPQPKPSDKVLRVLPLRLFVHDGATYLHAFLPKHDGMITLNLQRVRALEVLDELGEPPKGLDLAAWERAAFRIWDSATVIRYRLRFDKDATPYILERTWHPTQKIRTLADGRCELTFSCSPSYEVTSWVQSWGRAVTVIAPEELRAELHELGRWCVAQYGPRPGKPPAPDLRAPTSPTPTPRRSGAGSKR